MAPGRRISGSLAVEEKRGKVSLDPSSFPSLRLELTSWFGLVAAPHTVWQQSMNPRPATPRTRSAKVMVPAVGYGFRLSDEIERLMRRCRASVRTAIR